MFLPKVDPQVNPQTAQVNMQFDSVSLTFGAVVYSPRVHLPMGGVVTGSAALSARLLRFRMWDEDGAEGRPHKWIQWKRLWRMKDM